MCGTCIVCTPWIVRGPVSGANCTFLWHGHSPRSCSKIKWLRQTRFSLRWLSSLRGHMGAALKITCRKFYDTWQQNPITTWVFAATQIIKCGPSIHPRVLQSSRDAGLLAFCNCTWKLLETYQGAIVLHRIKEKKY